MQGPKIILIGALLAALPAMGWFWMFKPSGEEIARISADNRVKKQRIQEAERALSARFVRFARRRWTRPRRYEHPQDAP